LCTWAARYWVAVSLPDLSGPGSGVAELPLHLFWSSPDRAFSPNDPDDRIVTLGAADGDPHHWLTIPVGQLAATGLAGLLSREIRSLHSSVTQLRSALSMRMALGSARRRARGLNLPGGWAGRGC
jgi:hypothetical protein